MPYLLLLLLCLPLAANAEAYRWLDGGGAVHYGDHPPADALRLTRIPVYEALYRVKRVFDGDTVQLSDGRRVRIIGINTPELAHGRAPAEEGAEAARDWLRQRLDGREIRLAFDRERGDRHGRWLAYLHDGRGDDIGLGLLCAGLAHVNIYPPNTARIEGYLAAEAEARAAGLGIWSQPRFALIQLPDDEPRSGFVRLRARLLSIHDGRKYRALRLEGGVEALIPLARLADFPHLNGSDTLTLRGWLKRKGQGWRLYLNDPLQIEAVDKHL